MTEISPGQRAVGGDSVVSATVSATDLAAIGESDGATAVELVAAAPDELLLVTAVYFRLDGETGWETDIAVCVGEFDNEVVADFTLAAGSFKFTNDTGLEGDVEPFAGQPLVLDANDLVDDHGNGDGTLYVEVEYRVVRVDG